MNTLERLTSRRAWFVPDFNVWGMPSLAEHEYLALEKVDGTWSIYYGTASIGQDIQEVRYDQLVDHRGNALPDTIEAPRVFVRTRSADRVFVVGHEGSDRFKIARAADSAAPVTVDLWIVEVGR